MLLCDDLDGGGVEGRFKREENICTHIAGSRCSTVETNTTL